MWWLSPAGGVGILTLPTLILAAKTSDARYRFAWGTPKALTDDTVILASCGILIFIVAASISLLPAYTERGEYWPNLAPTQLRILSGASGPLFWLTISGYVAFAASGWRNGIGVGTVVQALRGQDVYTGTIRTALGQITGVTSLTQVGMAFVVVAMLLLVQRRDRRLRRRLVLVLLLALLRASLVGERLAVLELLIPAASVLAFRQASAGRMRWRMLTKVAPAVLLPMLLVAFGAFEYSRSWVFYKTRTTSSYSQFVVERFAGYYATSYNNGQLALDFESYAGRVPYDSIQALWTAPGASLFGGYPAPEGFDPPGIQARDLELHGNPEFNSPGGLITPFVDWGTVGGCVYMFILGGIVGLLYRRCVEGKAFAVVLYPSMTTGLFELPRYIYWPLGRYTPSLVALCVVGYLLCRDGHRRAVAADGPAPAAQAP